MEEKDLQNEVLEEKVQTLDTTDMETPLDKNVRLMSPTRMLLRRFFRSKLSVAGLIMLVALFAFCWLGPVVYQKWGEIETDRTGNIEYTYYEVEEFTHKNLKKPWFFGKYGIKNKNKCKKIK